MTPPQDEVVIKELNLADTQPTEIFGRRYDLEIKPDSITTHESQDLRKGGLAAVIATTANGDPILQLNTFHTDIENAISTTFDLNIPNGNGYICEILAPGTDGQSPVWQKLPINSNPQGRGGTYVNICEHAGNFKGNQLKGCMLVRFGVPDSTDPRVYKVDYNAQQPDNANKTNGVTTVSEVANPKILSATPFPSDEVFIPNRQVALSIAVGENQASHRWINFINGTYSDGQRIPDTEYQRLDTIYRDNLKKQNKQWLKSESLPKPISQLTRSESEVAPSPPSQEIVRPELTEAHTKERDVLIREIYNQTHIHVIYHNLNELSRLQNTIPAINSEGLDINYPIDQFTTAIETINDIITSDDQQIPYEQKLILINQLKIDITDYEQLRTKICLEAEAVLALQHATTAQEIVAALTKYQNLGNAYFTTNTSDKAFNSSMRFHIPAILRKGSSNISQEDIQKFNLTARNINLLLP